MPNSEIMGTAVDVVTAVSMALSTLDPKANFILSGISAWRSNRSIRLIKNTLTEFEARLNALDNCNMNYLNSDEFREIFLKTMHKVVADLREEKAKMFGDFLAGVAAQETSSTSDSYMMLEVLDKLELEHINFMKSLEPRTFSQNEDCPGWTTREEDLKILGVSEDRFSLLCDYLSGIGMVTRLEKFGINDNGNLLMHREYYLSLFGKKLFATLRLDK